MLAATFRHAKALLIAAALLAGTGVVWSLGWFRPLSVTRVDALEVINNSALGTTDANLLTLQGNALLSKTAANSSPTLTLQNDARSWSIAASGATADDDLVIRNVTGAQDILTLGGATFAATFGSAVTVNGGVTLNASSGTTTIRGTQFVGTGSVSFRAGNGTPEGAVIAWVGSLFLRQDGGASTTLYVKESGVGTNTGWVPVGGGGGGTNGTVSGGAVSGWADSVNLTTEGTIDWAAWDANMVNGPASSIGQFARQGMPSTNGQRANRIYGGFTCQCNGTTACNSANLCTSGTGAGNGVSTSTGSNNTAGSALTSNNVGPQLITTSAGSTQTISINLLPGESGTLCVYHKLVDVDATWRFDLYQDGASIDFESGNFSTGIPNLLIDERACVNFTAGTGHDTMLVYKGTMSALGGFNPHLYIMGATMF